MVVRCTAMRSDSGNAVSFCRRVEEAGLTGVSPVKGRDALEAGKQVVEERIQAPLNRGSSPGDHAVVHCCS